MKTKIFSSLIAVLMLNLCLNQAFAQDEKVYDHISLKTPPTYPGGIQKFYDFLGATIKYPTQAIENNVQGTVYTSFTIEKDGSLTDIKVDGKKLGSGTEEEAVRVLKLARKWNPGLYNEKPVRVKYSMPIKFAMPNKPKKAITSNNANTHTTPSTSGEGDKTVYSHVSMENPPTYPGGIAKFYNFLGTNMKYPKPAVDAKIEGTVYTSFTIEKDGSLSDIKVDGKKLGYGLDEEAVRVLKLSKRWNPGMQNGKVARTKYNIPVKFSLKK